MVVDLRDGDEAGPNLHLRMKLINRVFRTAFEPGVDWLEFVGAWLARELEPCQHQLAQPI